LITITFNGFSFIRCRTERLSIANWKILNSMAVQLCIARKRDSDVVFWDIWKTEINRILESKGRNQTGFCLLF